MRWRRALAVIVLIGTLGMGGTLWSCRAVPSDFSYLNEPAVVELEGELDGLAFGATLKSVGRDTGDGRLAVDQDFVLIYHAPAALAGVTVTYTALDGVYAVRLGGQAVSGAVYAALGEIGNVLLTEQAVERREREGDGIVLWTADGAKRIHDAESGRPREVVWRRGKIRVLQYR